MSYLVQCQYSRHEVTSIYIIMSPVHSSAPGVCSVCRQVFHTVPTPGVMRRLGHGGLFSFSASQVLNSGDQSIILDEGMCCSPSSSFHESLDSGSPLQPFQVPTNKDKLVKRIPKAARHKAAVV